MKAQLVIDLEISNLGTFFNDLNLQEELENLLEFNSFHLKSKIINTVLKLEEPIKEIVIKTNKN